MSRSGRSDMGCVRHSERGSCGEIILGYRKQITTLALACTTPTNTHAQAFAQGGRVRVSLDTLANDYPPDDKLTLKVQLFERRHLFQHWRERLGTSSANLVIWPMHVSERWGWMMRVLARKK